MQWINIESACTLIIKLIILFSSLSRTRERVNKGLYFCYVSSVISLTRDLPFKQQMTLTKGLIYVSYCARHFHIISLIPSTDL